MIVARTLRNKLTRGDAILLNPIWTVFVDTADDHTSVIIGEIPKVNEGAIRVKTPDDSPIAGYA